MNVFFKLGLVIFLVGCGPLLVMILLYEAGFNVTNNPIGLGLLFFFSLPFAVTLGIIGAIVAVVNRSQVNPSIGALPTDADTVNRAGLTGNPTSIQPQLDPEQRDYINHSCWGGCWGIFYYMYMNAPLAYAANLPSNLIYTNIIQNGRRQVWESGVWHDYEAFVRRNQQIDALTKPVLLVGLAMLVLVLFTL